MTTWKEIPAPAKKADYRYQFVRLLALPPLDGQSRSPGANPLPIRIGDVAKISMRRNAKETWGTCSIHNVSSWGNVRVLELEWPCPHCGQAHHILIPENWIAEGKAVFVEAAPKESAPASGLSLESAAFLRGVMYALAESVSQGGSTVGALEIAHASGSWEYFRAADCDEQDLRRFARKVGQQGIRSLRAERGRPHER